jgi:hypothetical protein
MNRKVLSAATKELNKAKAPAKPRDIFFDPSGQGMLNPKYAGKPVRLATDTLYNPTKYNIRAYADNGMSARLNPYDTTNVTLEGAKYIDEYPEMQEGGIYMDGDLTPEEIDYYAKGGFIIEDISLPQLTKAQKGKAVKPYYTSDPKKFAYRKKMYNDSLVAYNRDINFDREYINLVKKAKTFNEIYEGKLKLINKYPFNDVNPSIIRDYSSSPIIAINPIVKYKALDVIDFKKPTQPVVFKNQIVPTVEQMVTPAKVVQPPSGRIIRKPGDPKYVGPATTTSPSYPKTPMPYNNALHQNGGELTKAQKGKAVQPLEISDPKEFAYRNKMYADSSNLYKAYQMQDKLMGPGNYKTKDKYKWNTAELKEGRKKKIVKGLEDYGPISQDFQTEADQFKDGYKAWTARKEDKQLLDYYKKLGFKPNQIMYHSSPDLVNDKIKAVGSYFDGNAISPIYKKPTQPVVFKNQIVPTVEQMVTPAKVVQPSTGRIIRQPGDPGYVAPANTPPVYTGYPKTPMPYKNTVPTITYGNQQFLKGGALLTKKITCKKCGWKWDAADGGDDITTCHKCGGQGLVHAQNGVRVNKKGTRNPALEEYMNRDMSQKYPIKEMPSDNTKVVKPAIRKPKTKPVLADRNEQKALAQHLVNTGAASRYLGDNYDGSKTLNEAMLEKIQQNPNIMNSIDKQEYQYLLDKEQKAYDKASPLEKTASFVHSAIADPMLVGSNLIEGKAPMLWQGVNMRDDRNPETQAFYNQATGANDNTLNTAFNYINPGDWGTQAGIEADKGNYGTALGTLGLGIAGTAIGGPMFTGKGAAKALNKVDDVVVKPLVNYGTDVVETSRAAGELQLPKYKDVYRVEHAGFNKTANANDLTGRWFEDNPMSAKFYAKKLKDPVTGEMINDATASVRVMKKRLPEYKVNQSFGAAMPEEARIMSMGKGDLTNTQLDELLGPGASDRFDIGSNSYGKFTEQDFNAMETAPFLFRKEEGILNPDIVNDLRSKSTTFENQEGALNYLNAETNRIANQKKFQSYLPYSVNNFKIPNVPKEEMMDLYRIQEKQTRPMSELAAEGKLGPMFKNEKAIQHFKDREEHFGQWFTNDKNDIEWYKKDREFKDPELIQLKVPKSKLEAYKNYNKSLSSAPDREFVIPLQDQKLYNIQKKEGGIISELNKKEIQGLIEQGYVIEEQ